MLRVVLDLNLLISAALTPKGEARAILHQARVRYHLLLSNFMYERLTLVLRYPHIQAKYPQLTEDAIAHYLTYLRGLLTPVVERTTVTASSDDEDNRVLAAAVDGKAEYLVTRNSAHFPTAYEGIKIISPYDFRQRLLQSE